MNEFPPQECNASFEKLQEATLEGTFPLVNVGVEISSSLNRSSIIRATNGLLGRETIFVGSSEFPGLESDSRVKSAPGLEKVVAYLHKKGYFVWAVDNIEAYVPESIYGVELPLKSAFVFGREREGLSPQELELCDAMIFIPTPGPARSLNVAQAVAVTSGEYLRRVL